MGCTQSKSEITRNHETKTAESNSFLAPSSSGNNTQLSSPREELHRQQQPHHRHHIASFSPCLHQQKQQLPSVALSNKSPSSCSLEQTSRLGKTTELSSTQQEEDKEETKEGLYGTGEPSVEESGVSILPSFTSDQETSAMVSLSSEEEQQSMFRRPEKSTRAGPIISQWLKDLAPGTPPLPPKSPLLCDDHDDDDRSEKCQINDSSSRILSCTLTPNTSLTSNMPRFPPNALTPTGEWLFASSSPQQQEVGNEGFLDENTHSQHHLMPLVFQFDAYPLPPPHTATLIATISSSALHHPLLPPSSHSDLDSEDSRRSSDDDDDDDRESTVFTLSVDGSSTTSSHF